MRFRVLLSALVLLFADTFVQLLAQEVPSSPFPAHHNVSPPVSNAAVNAADGPLTTSPNWSSNFLGSFDAGQIETSVVYNQATNTMIVFGGLNDFVAGGGDTNAVVLYAPANGN